MNVRAACLLVVLFAAISVFPAAGAETPLPKGIRPLGALTGALTPGMPVNITADTLTFDEENGVATAEGNVEVVFGSKTIRADRIRYDSKTGEADLTAHVHYQDEGDEFSFDRVTLNIDNEVGVLYNGRIRLSTNNYQINSEQFAKTGKRTFFIRKGSLTTCPCCDPQPDWKFEVGRTRVTLDGYAVGKDVTFKVRGVPVLWLPYAAFPVKLTRQSGFLMPSFSHSGTKGSSFQLPFYWVTSRWNDVTITSEYMEKRGFRPEGEFRYILNRVSEGTAKATFYRDKEMKDERYRFYGKNIFRYGEDLTVNADWDLASDDRYYMELVDIDLLRTARHVPSKGFAGRGGDSSNQAIAVTWVKDVQGTPDDNTIQRLPEYTATLLPRSLGKSRVSFSGDVQATYFYRHEGNREYRGRGMAELSRSFTLYPSVVLTPYVFLDVLGSDTPSGVSEGREGRVLPGGGLVLQTDLRKDFDGGHPGKLVHAVTTAVGFRWVPPVAQDNIPITDQWSRVGPQEQVVLSSTQRFIRLGPESGPVDIASLELEWALNLDKFKSTGSPYIDPLSPYVRALRDQIELGLGRPRRTASISDVYARLSLTPVKKWKIAAESLFDPEDGRITTAAASGEWKQSADTHASAEYRISRDLAEDVHGLVAFRPFRVLGFEASVNYSIKYQKMTDGTTTLSLHPKSDCWSVGFVVSRKTLPDETSVKLTFTLKGIGTLGN